MSFQYSIYIAFLLHFILNHIKCNNNDQSIKDKGKSYEIPISLTKQNHPLIQICIGTPPQCLKVKIATNVDITFIIAQTAHYNGFESLISSTFRLTTELNTVHYGLSTHTGREAYDVMEIPNTEIKDPNFRFVYLEGGIENPTYQGILGLGPPYRKSSYSLIHSMVDNAYITTRHFLISYHPKRSKGRMLIGNIDIDTEMKNKQCLREVYAERMQYECKMKSVIYHIERYVNETYLYLNLNKHNVIFSPGTDILVCPKEFFEFMKDNIFNELLSMSVCVIEGDRQGFKILVCSRDVFYQTFGNLLFILGKWNLKQPVSELFKRQRDERFRFLIMHHSKIDQWIFGYHIFKHYEVLFDLETNVIHFKPNRYKNDD